MTPSFIVCVFHPFPRVAPVVTGVTLPLPPLQLVKIKVSSSILLFAHAHLSKFKCTKSPLCRNYHSLESLGRDSSKWWQTGFVCFCVLLLRTDAVQAMLVLMHYQSLLVMVQ